MLTSLNQYLQYIGLSEKETRVYEYLLSVNSAFPVNIAKEIKLKRSTVYVILSLLKEKGMVREISKGKNWDQRPVWNEYPRPQNYRAKN